MLAWAEIAADALWDRSGIVLDAMTWPPITRECWTSPKARLHGNRAQHQLLI